jgi:hypothetical protein
MLPCANTAQSIRLKPDYAAAFYNRGDAQHAAVLVEDLEPARGRVRGRRRQLRVGGRSPNRARGLAVAAARTGNWRAAASARAAARLPFVAGHHPPPGARCYDPVSALGARISDLLMDCISTAPVVPELKSSADRIGLIGRRASSAKQQDSMHGKYGVLIARKRTRLTYFCWRLISLTFTAAWVVLSVGSTCMLFGLPADQQRSFDVASVKPTLKDNPITDIIPRRSGDRVIMHNSELTAIVAWAYHLTNRNYQLVLGRWEKSVWENYDVDAIAPSSTSENELRIMFQTLLEDRFKLKAHREIREMPTYDLNVARGGPRLVPAKPGPKRSLGFGGSSSWVEITDSGPVLAGRGASIAELAVVLSGQSG